MSYDLQEQFISGVILFKPKIFSDARGYFLETYKESEFVNFGLNLKFVQDDISCSNKNVLRGLHYQREPKAHGQLMRVVEGRVWDVVVDIRKGSPTFKKWFGLELNDENNFAIYMPPGLAHGFAVLSETAKMYYKCTAEFDASLDGGIRWNDPEIGITWPVAEPIISEKDSNLPFLGEAILFE